MSDQDPLGACIKLGAREYRVNATFFIAGTTQKDLIIKRRMSQPLAARVTRVRPPLRASAGDFRRVTP
jgi:hypothetical protein